MKELLRRNVGEDEEKWPKRKVPISKDPPTENQEQPKVDEVRRAQKGEALWLVTRTRPDMMFALAKMASQVLHQPHGSQRAHPNFGGTWLPRSKKGSPLRKVHHGKDGKSSQGLLFMLTQASHPQEKKVTAQ